MRTIKLKIAAGDTESIGVTGDYVRVRLAPYDVLIFNTKNGQTVEASQGDDFELDAFDALKITNTGATDEFFKFTIAQGKKAGSSPGVISGSVTILNPAVTPINNGIFTQSRASVTNVNQAIIAANASRKYLLIQNNDSGAFLRVKLDGTNATAAQGFRVAPNGILELPNFSATSAINCMMETASAAVGNVEFVEG